jgi:hypothetical protein
VDVATREQISEHCLLGVDVPPSLEVVWDVQQDPFLTQTVGLRLLTSRAVLDDGYGDDVLDQDPDTAAHVLANRRLFRRLAFFAECDGGELLAFDVRTGSAEDPPVVQLDTEGRYGWSGLNLAEALYWQAEAVGEPEAAVEWLARVGLTLVEPGELGTTTQHLPDLGKLVDQWCREPDAAAPDSPEPPNAPDGPPATATDALTWLGRPGPAVLARLREVLGLAQGEHPHRQWIACDAAGRVDTIWLRDTPLVTVAGIGNGASRAAVVGRFGEPSEVRPGVYERHPLDAGRFLRVEYDGDTVRDLYLGTDSDLR